jgi:perosamine synthetase
MIPRFKPFLGLKEILTLMLPAAEGSIKLFEMEFAKKMNQKYGIAFPYGRTALIALLETLELKNTQVICPAYTCVVVAHAIVKSGNIPVFADSSEKDFNMDMDHVESLINENTSVIIATSIFGYPVDLDRLDDIKKKYPHIKILQDCAHSFSAKWKGRAVNTAGDAAFFGLNASKIITTIFGGIVTTDDENYRQKLILYRDKHIRPASFGKGIYQRVYLFAFYFAFKDFFYTFVNWLERKGALSALSSYYEEGIIDMPSDYLEMMTPIGAKIGLIQIKKYDHIVAVRINTAHEYSKKLNGIPGLILPPLIEGATYSHYVPRLADKWTVKDKCIKDGVQLGWLIEYSIPEMKAYLNYPQKSKCEVASKLKNETINLPLNTKKTEKIVQTLIKNHIHK